MRLYLVWSYLVASGLSQAAKNKLPGLHRTRRKEHFNHHREQIFTEKPRDQLLQQHQKRAVLRCSIGANNKDKLAKVQWAKDGMGLGLNVKLPDFPRYNITKDEVTGNVDLIISDVQFDDDGRYECQVRPNFRVGAQITVASPPSGILLTVPASLQPNSGSNHLISVDQSKKLVTVVAGHTIVVECLVDQSRPPTNVTASSESLDLFSISQKNLKDDYLNSATSNGQSSAILSKFIQNSGDLAQLVISEPGTNTFKTTSRYTFVADPVNQNSLLTCSGQFWEVFSKTGRIQNDYKLNVLSKPVVATRIDKTKVVENSAIHVSCDIKSANPRVKSVSVIASDKNDENVVLAEKSDFNSPTFDPNFEVKLLRNFKTVFCQAENEVGSSENTPAHKIDVFFGPEPNEPLASKFSSESANDPSTTTEFQRTIEIKSGQALNLNCAQLFESSPPPQVNIQKYSLKSAKVNDSGVYECTAYNSETKKSVTIFNNLQVHGAPVVKSLSLDSELFCDYVSYPEPSEVLIKLTNSATGVERVLGAEIDENEKNDEMAKNKKLSSYSLAEVKQFIATNEDNFSKNEKISDMNIYSVECRVRNVHGEHYISQEFDFSEENNSFILHVAIGSLITIGFAIFLTLLLIYFKNKILSKDQGSFNCGDSGKASDKSLISHSTKKSSQNSSLYESDGQITGNSAVSGIVKNAFQYDDQSCSITDGEDVLLVKDTSECSHNLILGTRSSSSNEESGQIASNSSNRDDGYYTDGHNNAHKIGTISKSSPRIMKQLREVNPLQSTLAPSSSSSENVKSTEEENSALLYVKNLPILSTENYKSSDYKNSDYGTNTSDHIYIGKSRHGTGNTTNSNIRVLPTYAVDPYENPDLMRQITDRVNNNGTLNSKTGSSNSRRYTSARRSKPCSQV